jgi:polysaccharide chain length determinant protein (PEP-CTERM system associated)
MEFLSGTVRQSLAVAWRRRWRLILAGWAVCIFGWTGVALLPDSFESRARLYVDTDAVLTPLLRGLAIDTANASQVEVMQRTLLSQPNLYKLVGMTQLGLGVADADQKEQLVARIARDVKLSSEGRNLFTITYRNSNPKIAQEVVQALLTMLMESTTGVSRSEMENAQKFLRGQIAIYEEQLQTAEKRRAAFHQKYLDILPSDGAGGRSQLDTAREEVRKLETELQDVIINRDGLRQEVNITKPTVLVEPPQAQSSQAQLAEAERNLAALRTRYTEQHPDAVAARRLVQTLRAAPAEPAPPPQAGPVGRSMPNPVYEQLKVRLVEAESKVLSVQNRLESSQRDRDRLEEIARAAPGVEAEFANLNRDYNIIRKNYEELLGRREATKISAAADTSADKVKLRVVDPAQVPLVPVGPNRPLLVSGVFVGGLAAIGLLGVLFAQTDRSVGNVTSLRDLGLPVLGGISIARPPSRAQRYRQAIGAAAALLLLTVLYGGMIVKSSRFPF